MSEFWQLVDDEFGSGYGRVLVDGHTLHGLGSRTAAAALDEGESPRAVWLALCREMDIPQERWLGIDRPIRERRDI
ncbi:DUF3046 domain-containing protein [Yimella sp. cx-51]|uniref:DUF3046 domain-containing protein n=1 Tax=Yimella sp. cx-51 TaxID=2770551 RepID=UPI001CB6EA9A|nr:DUF3046 domain-containing protein [Yimella sp. cx-51]